MARDHEILGDDALDVDRVSEAVAALDVEVAQRAARLQRDEVGAQVAADQPRTRLAGLAVDMHLDAGVDHVLDAVGARAHDHLIAGRRAVHGVVDPARSERGARADRVGARGRGIALGAEGRRGARERSRDGDQGRARAACGGGGTAELDSAHWEPLSAPRQGLKPSGERNGRNV